MAKIVCVASNNAHKVSEISNALDFPGWEFKSLRDLGVISDPVEDADTFSGNARIKALAAHEATGGMACLADDSGIAVDALGGAPGVYSARYACAHADDQADDDANNAKLLRELADVPYEQRTGRFCCALHFVDEDGSELSAFGTVEGKIGYEPAGENGFGYDPLFWPDAFGGEKTTAQVSQEEKALISHRGNALRALKAQLEERA